MVVNGVTVPFAPGSLLQYLEREGFNLSQIVVERNLEIITREHFDEVALAPEDEINILHFMGGG